MTIDNTEEPTRTYRVVVNAEEQYSLWRADKPLPNGWSALGKVGTKQECLAYIESAWTDMRPLSLRRQMSPATASADLKLN
jgi:MbtH protein